jgi:hypothetical protein
MSQTKIKNDIKNLLKMGLPEEMAYIVAYSNNGKPEEASDYFDLVKDEQELIMKEIQNCGFVPFENNITPQIIDVKNEKSDIQYIESKQ